MLATSNRMKPGVATVDERRHFYELCKRGEGLSGPDRNYVWLQVTGAQGLLNHSLNTPGADYQSMLLHFDTEFPTVNRHQIEVDMPRTFPDEAFFKSNKEKEVRENTPEED